MLLLIGVWVSFFVLWWLGRRFAGLDNFITVEGMQSHGTGFERGIPFDGHMAGKYLDLLTFPVVVATWVALYSHQWKSWQIVLLLVVGVILSGVMHLTYIEAGKKFPEYVTYSGKLTSAGCAHVVYMGYGFAIVGLAYLCTKSPEPTLVWLTTAYLVVHVVIGVHVPYKIFTPSWFPYHGIWDAGTLAPILGSAAVLSGLSWWALR